MAVPLNIGNLLEQSGILPQQQQQLGAGNVDLQSLLNVKPPSLFNAPVDQMMMPDALTGGSSFGYAPAFQPSTPYSATNLPEFMQGYEQTPSGRFVMSQGLLGVPPTMDKVQSLFSQGYSSEYDPLEKQFQESFAVDPSWFGNVYRSGYMIPSVPRGVMADSSSGLAGAIAGGLALKELYPYAEDAFGAIKDVVSPVTKSIEETFGGLFEEYVTQPIKETAIDPLVGAYKESALKKDIIDPSIDVIQGFGKKLDETFDKPEFINNIQEKAKEYLSKIQGSNITQLGGDAFKAYGNIENLVNNPNPMDAFKAIDAMNKLTTYLPEDLQKSVQGIAADIGPAVGVVLDTSAVASIVNAFDNPTPVNIANAYGSLDYFAQQGRLGSNISGLPYAENIAGIGNIIGGLQALEGGIDSAGEALQVATGAATAASMFGGGTAIGSAGAAALPVLGPIAALYGAFQVLNKPEANLGHAIVGRDDFGGYSISSEGYKGEGESIAKPEANAAMLVLGELERNYGYKFNADAWEKVNKRVDFDNGRWVRGAHDVIIDALQKGALVPTEGTPRSLDFVNMLNDARLYASEAPYVTGRSMSSYARGQERARQMAESGSHPLEVARAKAGLDVFQWGADINEGFGKLSNMDLSGLSNIVSQADIDAARSYVPPPEPEYYEFNGKTYTLAELQKALGGGLSFPNPFAGFTAPRYG